MFQLLQQMEQLVIFLEVLGYIAIALMLLQIILTIGLLAYEKTHESSNKSSHEPQHESSYDSSIVRESQV